MELQESRLAIPLVAWTKPRLVREIFTLPGAKRSPFRGSSCLLERHLRREATCPERSSCGDAVSARANFSLEFESFPTARTRGSDERNAPDPHSMIRRLNSNAKGNTNTSKSRTGRKRRRCHERDFSFVKAIALGVESVRSIRWSFG